jgi:prophage antirepressor-like protein
MDIVKINKTNIRNIELNGKLYFLLKDIAQMLNYKSTTFLLNRCREEGVIRNKLLTKGGEQIAVFIDYENIMLILNKSQKSKAVEINKAFSKFIAQSLQKNYNQILTVQTNSADLIIKNIENTMQNLKSLTVMIDNYKLQKQSLQNTLDKNVQLEKIKQNVLNDVSTLTAKINNSGINRKITKGVTLKVASQLFKRRLVDFLQLLQENEIITYQASSTGWQILILSKYCSNGWFRLRLNNTIEINPNKFTHVVNC